MNTFPTHLYGISPPSFSINKMLYLKEEVIPLGEIDERDIDVKDNYLQ
jgi:hypothetical protein